MIWRTLASTCLQHCKCVWCLQSLAIHCIQSTRLSTNASPSCESGQGPSTNRVPISTLCCSEISHKPAPEHQQSLYCPPAVVIATSVRYAVAAPPPSSRSWSIVPALLKRGSTPGKPHVSKASRELPRATSASWKVPWSPLRTQTWPLMQVLSCMFGLIPSKVREPASVKKSSPETQAKPILHQQSRYWPPAAVGGIGPQAISLPDAETFWLAPAWAKRGMKFCCPQVSIAIHKSPCDKSWPVIPCREHGWPLTQVLLCFSGATPTIVRRPKSVAKSLDRPQKGHASITPTESVLPTCSWHFRTSPADSCTADRDISDISCRRESIIHDITAASLLHEDPALHGKVLTQNSDKGTNLTTHTGSMLLWGRPNHSHCPCWELEVLGST